MWKDTTTTTLSHSNTWSIVLLHGASVSLSQTRIDCIFASEAKEYSRFSSYACVVAPVCRRFLCWLCHSHCSAPLWSQLLINTVSLQLSNGFDSTQPKTLALPVPKGMPTFALCKRKRRAQEVKKEKVSSAMHLIDVYILSQKCDFIPFQ